MFGIYRTLLALFVVIGHLFGPGQLGTYAVFGFYVLSGYLMTFIMHHNYGYHLEGRKRFVINRLLRIYPPYYMAILISIVLLWVFGDQVTQFKSTIYMPSNFWEYMQNIFLVFPPRAEPRLSPPTWALTIELFYYACICWGISKSKKITWFWLVGSVLFTIFLLWTKAPWVERYFTISAASLPFSMGAIIYHYKDELSKWFKQLKLNNPLMWMGLMCLNFLTFYSIETITDIPVTLWVGFYINLIILACLLIVLLEFKSEKISRKVDSTIGNYSYPIYLVHYQAGALLFGLLGNYLEVAFLTAKGMLFLLLSILITFIISYLIIQFIDRPIERVRRKIKKVTH
jgi:peptidoglycan/LPS O-acetylase OafA/YrhL